MAQCILVGSGVGESEQLGIYPVGANGRPTGDVIVPSGVTGLSYYVFRYNTNVTSVDFADGITELWDYAFQDCTALTTVSLPESLVSIGEYVFDGCTALTQIELPVNVTVIPEHCFYDCTGLTDVEIKATGEVTISADSFFNCSSLENVTISSDEISKLTVSGSAFYKCEKLTDESANIILSKIKSLGTHAFAYCTGLKNVSGMFCNDYMFQGCTGLETANITRTLSSGDSGQYVFSGCTNLKEIIYGETVIDNLTAIERCYCDGCTSLTSFTVPANVTTVSAYAFGSCTSMTYLYLPSTITSLTASAINTCTALENIELGQDWNLSVNFSFTSNLTADSMVTMFNSLKDLTGSTAKTLTLGSTNLAKLTDEQKAIATNKNWTLA